MADVDPAGPSPTVPPAPPAFPLEAVSNTLRETQPWTRAMGIIGFVGVAFLLLGGVAAGATGFMTGNPAAVALLVVYPLIALLYAVPSMYLLRYSKRIRQFVVNREPAQLEAALESQRAFWKFVTILTLAGFVIGGAMTLIAVLAGVVAGIAGVGPIEV